MRTNVWIRHLRFGSSGHRRNGRDLAGRVGRRGLHGGHVEGDALAEARGCPGRRGYGGGSASDRPTLWLSGLGRPPAHDLTLVTRRGYFADPLGAPMRTLRYVTLAFGIRTATLRSLLLAAFLLASCDRPATDDAAATPTVTPRHSGPSAHRARPRAGIWTPPLATVVPILDSADAAFTNLEGRRGRTRVQLLTDPRRRLLPRCRARSPRLPGRYRCLVAVAGQQPLVGLRGRGRGVHARGGRETGGSRTRGPGGPSPTRWPRRTATSAVLRIGMVAVATVNAPPEAMATDTETGVNLMPPDDTVAWNRNIGAIRRAAANSDVLIAYHHYQIDATRAPGWQERWARGDHRRRRGSVRGRTASRSWRPSRLTAAG